MILKTETIKQFLNEANLVRPNIECPNLNDLVKIEYLNGDIILTKTNLNVFCTLKFVDTGFHLDEECYIVGHKTLNGLAQTTTSDTITIQQDGNNLKINGHKKEVVNCPIIQTGEFPATPENRGDAIPMESELLFCIDVAGNYISQEQRITAASYVHVNKKGVFSTNNNNIVYNRIFDLPEMPNIFLGSEALAVIKPSSQATYTTQGNFDFINYANGYSFGFRKSVIEAPINYEPMFVQKGEILFTIMRQNLLNYCKLVGYVAKGEYPMCTLSFDGKIVSLDHNDPNFNIEIHKEYEVAYGPMLDGFKFSASYLELFLKNLPYTDLTFSLTGQHFKITTHEDDQFRCIFAGLS